MPYITRQDNISALPLSVRSQNCLRHTGIHTIGELMDYPAEEFINIRNMGVRSVEEIKGFIQALLDGTGAYVLVEATEEATDVSSAVQESADTITVFLDETGSIVPDIAVKELPLSVRAKNSLTCSGYKFASQLVGVTFEKLMNMHNMGKKTAEEVFAYIGKLSVSRRTYNITNENHAFCNDLAAEMCAAYGETESVWQWEVLSLKMQFPDAAGETLIYRLYDSAFVRGILKAKILRIIEENNDEISKANLHEYLPQHLSNTTVLEEILLELETASAVEIGEVMIFRQYPSIVEFASKIKDDRIREVIQGRIEGKTLQDIGNQYGITRERVRQLMQKGLRAKPYLREDRYAYIYDHYDISQEDFMLAFDEPEETYYYLEMICPTDRKQRKTLDDILTDTVVAPAYRKKAERVIYKQYITADGVRIRKNRPALVKHAVKVYCRQLTRMEDFRFLYHTMLEELGLGEDPSLRIEQGTYENPLIASDYVLWNNRNNFRYYDIAGRDFEDFLSTIRLEQYLNTEISSLKIYKNHPELMQQYDIRDEYELHNLLKKIWPQDICKIKFARMPTMEIGNANREEQVLSLLLQYAPISAEDLAAKYEEAYGSLARTVQGSHLKILNPYFFDGIYSIDYAELPAKQSDHMKEILDRTFYTIPEVKEIYRREFPGSDISLINPYTLKNMDFHVYPAQPGYIVKKTYAGATDYFNELLTHDDIVDTGNISWSIRELSTYNRELYRLRHCYEIIEYAPAQYINIRRLNAAGITAKLLTDYCESVAAFYEKGEYFTVTSLLHDGFSHSLDDLGFDEWFYASVLVENTEYFSYQRIGKTRIFLRGKPNAQLSDMLCWLLEKYQKIDIYDIVDLLADRYGIMLQKEKVVEILRNTELYYDAIMEAVYIDYDTYFEEI